MSSAPEQMQRALRRCRPLEACGVVLRSGAVVELTNPLDVPGRFTFIPEEYADFAPLTVAIWHTHPNGSRVPSAADIAGHPPGVDMLIVTDEGVFWHGDPTRQDPAS